LYIPDGKINMPEHSSERGFTKILRLRNFFGQYPGQFWVLVLGTFIDRLGGALLFPFFTLYVTKKFNAGMTQVGIIFAIFSLSSVVGSFIGGSLSDRLGRKGVLLTGLITSALASLLMGVVSRIEIFYLITVMVGLLSNSAGPAQQAMVADLLPREKQAEGFGILRVAINLSASIGPMIGGLLAAHSYMLLFASDALTSLLTAAIVYFTLTESRPKTKKRQQSNSKRKRFGGYIIVLRDQALVWFLIASMLVVVVFIQRNTTLAVFLRDIHNITEQGFGYLLSLSAVMVVLLQFPITRWIKRYRPLMVMAAGTLLYAIGFMMYGFVNTYYHFILAIMIITIGEMLVSPVAQAIVARMAPEDMRGRYMAVFNFCWIVPIAFGPLLAGLVMDFADPNYVWYAAGLLGLIAGALFCALERQSKRAAWIAAERRLEIIEGVEQAKLSAEKAVAMMEEIPENSWTRLASDKSLDLDSINHIHIRSKDLSEDDEMNIDLRLPMGMIYIALDSKSRLTTDLDQQEDKNLQDLLAQQINGHGSSHPREDGSDIEISIEGETPEPHGK
jgi:MFS family permease